MTKFKFSKKLRERHERQFLLIPKEFVTNMTWANLSLSSKKILPVIAIHGKEVYAKRERLMKLAGYVKKKIFFQSLDELKSCKLLSTVKSNENKKQSIYNLLNDSFYGNSGKNDNEYFQLRANCIYSGYWAVLPPIAVAVYVTLGAFSKGVYYNKSAPEFIKNYIENEYGDDVEYGSYVRECRNTSLSISQIQKFSGVCRDSVIKSLRILEESYMIMRGINFDDACDDVSLYYIFMNSYLKHNDLKWGYWYYEPESLNTKSIEALRREKFNQFNYHKYKLKGRKTKNKKVGKIRNGLKK